MHWPLVRKELNSLFPFLALVLFFVALDLVFFLFSEFPDQYPLSELLQRDEDGYEQLSFIIAFALASGILVREREEGTLAFLDALPISRSRIFFTKLILGLSVLWLLPVLDISLRAIVYAASRTSLETPGQWHIFATALFLSMTSTVVYFSLGLALSFLRKFSLLILGLIFSGYFLLYELQVPYIGLFNIFSLSEPAFLGQKWLFPTAKFFLHLACAAALLGISFLGFQAMGDVSQRLAQRLRGRGGLALLSALGIFITILLWISLGAYAVRDLSPDDDKNVVYRDWSTSRAQTARFHILYPENKGTLANQVIDSADQTEQIVRNFLAARPIPRIHADWTSTAPHTAGVAHWKKVQMDLQRLHTTQEALAVLAHEITHVYLDHESDSTLSDRFNSTRFFHEGLASYVEHRFFRPEAQLPLFRRPAAAARSRTSVRLTELFDDRAFARKQDPDLVYPLGEIFVAALVMIYGDAAPGQIARAFNRPDAVKDLEGLALWQDVFQASNFNLSEVENLFLQELDRLVLNEQEFLESLPRLRGFVSHETSGPVVTASFDGTAPGFLVCRIRDSAETEPQHYSMLYDTGKGRFHVPRGQLTKRTFWYQLGWQVPQASQPIFETWVAAPVQ